MNLTYLNLAAEKLGKTECELLQDFIEENRDVTLAYILRSDSDSCEDMVNFIGEMKLETKVMIYADIRLQLNK